MALWLKRLFRRRNEAHLIETKLLDWPGLIARLTANPAAVIGRAIGTLAVGARADVTIIDPKKRWTVNVNNFASRSRNCPYHGWKLTGRAVVTIVGGKIKFQL